MFICSYAIQDRNIVKYFRSEDAVVTYNDASADMKLILSNNKGRYYSTKSSVCGFVKDANSIVSNRVKEKIISLMGYRLHRC